MSGEDIFVKSMLEQMCFIRCNEGRQDAQAGQAKENCVKGCLLAAGKPVKAAYCASIIMRLDDEFHHSRVLTTSELEEVVSKTTQLCDKLKIACDSECVSYCASSESGDSGKQRACVANCSRGCKTFVDSLSV